ncbi:uncharacterized protein LOC132634377 [Lycium barbarum]|uniref:uncharacterized protein LOC132634377 n=1 Tax=Lycium barbarum TaxID=112863 RepID=UPI00293F0317|nr:uncharacterized protein LOC132634377 [Lycium barbarum]
MLHLLEIKATISYIREMQPSGGPDDENMPYFFTLKCEKCGAVTEEQCCYMSGAFPHKGKEVNHVAKCQGCDREGTVTLLPGYGSKFTGGDYTPLMMFDCKGLVPEEYNFNGGWKLVTESGHEIEADLLGGKFTGPKDMNGNCPSVEDCKGRFKVKHV